MAYIAFALFVSVALFALGRKWDFRKHTVQLWTGLMLIAGATFMAGLTVVWPSLHTWALFILGSGAAFGITLLRILYLFYRDPERTPPTDDRIIVSPADGRIVYISEVADGTFPFAVKKGRSIPISQFTSEDFPAEEFVHIGIEMTEALLENERVYTLIRGPELTLGMLQIASRMVRRIVPFVAEGDDITIGKRIGTIRFGSQVDLPIPRSDSLEVLVKVDDAMRAGETVLARY